MSAFDQANILIHPTKDRSLLVIIAGVMIGHLLLLLWTILTHSDIKPLPSLPQRRLIVQTIALNPKPRTTSSTLVLQNTPLKKNKNIPEVVKEIEEVKTAEPELISAAPIPKIEKEILPTPITEEPSPKEVPLPEIKEESAKQISEEPKAVPIKPIEQTPPSTKVETKKPEVKMKKIETEKPIVKKTVVKKAIPQKAEAQKREKVAVKPPEKKAAAPQAPSQQTKPKKVEIDKAAMERQKKLEIEQQAAKAKQQKLLSQAQETIAKIDKSRDKISRTNLPDPGFVPPGAISSLQIDSFADYGSKQQLSSQEASYRDELASRLKLLLKLPEYGEVKIKLTLERSGKVAKVVIISAASAANRKHVEKTLPTLTFPAFGANFDQSSQFTFSITLCNEI